MQNELNSEHADLGIQIIGMNEIRHEVGNPGITEGRDLPWLQDVDANDDNASDVWLTEFSGAYRDVIIVDQSGEQVLQYNLTSNDLGNSQNFEELKQLLIDNANTPQETWHNESMPEDTNGDGRISSIDALVIINSMNLDGGSRELGTFSADSFKYDVSNDGAISPIDALMVINFLNKRAAEQAEGELPIERIAAAAVATETTTLEDVSVSSAELNFDVRPNSVQAVDRVFDDATQNDDSSNRSLLDTDGAAMRTQNIELADSLADQLHK